MMAMAIPFVGNEPPPPLLATSPLVESAFQRWGGCVSLRRPPALGDTSVGTPNGSNRLLRTTGWSRLARFPVPPRRASRASWIVTGEHLSPGQRAMPYGPRSRVRSAAPAR